MKHVTIADHHGLKREAYVFEIQFHHNDGVELGRQQETTSTRKDALIEELSPIG